MSSPRQLLDLAFAHHQHGRFDDAEVLYRQILVHSPHDVDALHLLGLIHYQKGQYAAAIACMQQALSIKPDFVEAHDNLGHALRGAGRLDDAAASIQRALQLQPNFAPAYKNLAVVLIEQGKFDEAVTSCQRAIDLNPVDAEAYSNLGGALWNQGRLDEAATSLTRALDLKPDMADAHSNLGIIRRSLGRAREAIVSFEHALRLQPDHADAHWNLSMALLASGDLERGWREYEWRWKRKEMPPRVFPQPRWDGGSLRGRSILLCSEQGLGDTIQFLRYAAVLKEQGARVIVSCQKPLLGLLEDCPGIDHICARNEEPAGFDVWSPLLSVPGLVGTTLETIPATVPYLFAKTERVEHWRRYLSRFDGFKVGICWQGSQIYRGDRYRSIPLAEFAALATLEGVQLLSLQKGQGADQIREVDLSVPVIDFGGTLDASSPFVDTAAVMMNLDLVISADTAIAHLAGALGVPVWTAIAAIRTEWRWLLDRENTPWYPTMRLFRQSTSDDWSAVFKRMAGELKVLADQKSRGLSLRVEVAGGELFDKITILQIKTERISSAAKLENIKRELASLLETRQRLGPSSTALESVIAELKKVNETLWDIEDKIRDCERAKKFDKTFVELARSVYHQNDHRSALKRQINDLLGSKIVEEKSYQAY
jgi:tetratricopeptide (TPR) repeat protein/ADP-heptose:LPS heptosyltransferase